MTNDEAAQQLGKHHNSKWLKERLAAAGQLNGRSRKLARALLETVPDAESDGQADSAATLCKPVLQLEEFGEKERLRIFEVVCPMLAADLEAAWQRTYGLSYETEAGRQLFRAPSLPSTTHWLRVRLVRQVVRAINGYDQDVVWLASWAPHLAGFSAADELGLLFAAAIDRGGQQGQEVFDILCSSARGEHATGAMGRHVTRGLLLCSRRQGWELLAGLLRNEATPESVRQVILESIDEAQPEAFRWMLRQILASDLIKSPSVIHTLDVWLAYQWDSVSERVVRGVLEKVLDFLEHPEARLESVANSDAEIAYLALWATACEDAREAASLASGLLESANVERRFVAVHLLDQLDLPLTRSILVEAVEDEDPRVALYALEGCQLPGASKTEDLGLFERVESLLARLPQKKQALQPIVWPWQVLVADRADVASELIEALGERPPGRLLAHAGLLSPPAQLQLLERLGKPKSWDATTRTGAIALLRSGGQQARFAAFRALACARLSAVDILALEALLLQDPEELARGVIDLLESQRDRVVLGSIGRLVGSISQRRRLAGLELLQRMLKGRRASENCRELLAQFQQVRRHHRPEEEKALERLASLTRKKSKTPR